MSQIENDRKIINDFKDSVSWGDETITTENYGRAYLHFLNVFCVPTNAENYQKDKDFIIELATKLGFKPGLILDGEFDNVEEIMYECSIQHVYTDFLEVNAKVRSIRFLTSMLDGVDWGRTIPHVFANGVNAKPIMEWDD